MIKTRSWLGVFVIPLLLIVAALIAADRTRSLTTGDVIDPTCASSSPCIQYDNTSTGAGIRGNSTQGRGVVGVTTFNSTSFLNMKAGIFGQDNSTTGSSDAGVEGTSTRGLGVYAASSSGPGIEAVSNTGFGVTALTFGGRIAAAINAFSNGSAMGVQSFSASGPGVKSTSSSGTGVSGTSSSGIGVFAQSSSNDGAFATSASNDGINASTTNNSTSAGRGRSGIFAHDDSTDGGTLNCGVCGFSARGTGTGGTSSFGPGVNGASFEGTGVNGAASQGVGVNANGGVNDTNGSGVDLPALSIQGGTFAPGGNPPPVLIAACSANAFPVCDGNDSFDRVFTLDQNGNIQIKGTIKTAGVCSSGCTPSLSGGGSRVISYVPRESLPIMEDFGEANLIHGRAYVPLDSAYANVIDRQANYLVFITPEGDANTLYVAQKSQTGFAVVESHGGVDSIGFQYRIVAKPLGSSERRLPMVYERPPSRRVPRVYIVRPLSHA